MSERALRIDTIIGIDPGKNGGIAIYMPGVGARVERMPKDTAGLVELLRYYVDNFHPVAFLEKLSVHLDDATIEGGKPNMGKVMRIQRLIANYEQLKTVLEAIGMPFVMVHPLSWQTKLRLRIRGEKEDKRMRKRRYVQAAQSLYPDVRATLWNSDALLIMQFGRYALANEMSWVRENLPEREFNKLFV